MPALGLLALPTLWASSSIRGVDHPSVARLVKDWAQSTWLTKGLYEMLADGPRLLDSRYAAASNTG